MFTTKVLVQKNDIFYKILKITKYKKKQKFKINLKYLDLQFKKLCIYHKDCT